MKKYTINGRDISFNVHQFEGKKSLEEYEQQIYSTLSKIGVTKEYVEIDFSDDEFGSFAQVMWKINGKNFVFRCESQDNAQLNMGAIAQALQEDVRQVTRGIKDLFSIMNQYEINKKKVQRKRGLMNFSGEETSSEEAFPVDKNRIDAPVENENLDKKYEYLLTYPNEKLDYLYSTFKDKCQMQNLPDHPMLRALKIVRQRRRLKL